MTTLTFSSPRVALPDSPKNIPPDASLDDLQEIKSGWVNQARALGWHQQMWDAAAWLGNTVRQYPRLFKLWCPDPSFALIGHEETDRFVPGHDPAQNALVPSIKRTVTAWVGNFGPDWTRPIDAVVLYGDLVARWRWRVVGEQVKEIEDDLLFIPGTWVHHIQVAAVQADETAQTAGMLQSETRRQALLTELLVGRVL